MTQQKTRQLFLSGSRFCLIRDQHWWLNWHSVTGSRADKRELMGLHVWEQGLLTLVEVNCWLSDYHPRKMKPKASNVSTKINFRYLKMQFSKTSCFAQAQLRPVRLCLWSRTSPAACTSSAAPLPAPDTLPTLAGRIFVCLPRELGWELVQLKSNFCTQLTCKVLWQ